MATSKTRRKWIVFMVLGLVLAGLTVVAIVRKREVVVSVQTEKIARRNLTEIVVANGKIQPVVQVKISPEVSGEITALPFKEGQAVKKGELIVKIKPDFYLANRNQAEASYQSSVAAKATAEANLRKAAAEYKRNQGLFASKLISDSAFDEVKAAYDVAQAQLTSSQDQVEMARASLASAQDSLDKTSIGSPLTGTVSKLNSEVGERVVGTATMAGTEVMTVADLNEMEARVDIGEIDVVLIKPGQTVKLEVDAFKDRKFTGIVTEVANSSKTSTTGGVGTSTQEATKFEIRIRIKEKEDFRPGMSVTANIETRYRTNVLTVPIASVTTRLPKDKDKDKDKKGAPNFTANAASASSDSTDPSGQPTGKSDKKSKEAAKPIEVVFLAEGDRAKMVPVKIGISDDSWWEILDGVKEGQEVVSGGYRAISKDLEDGKKIRRSTVALDKEHPDEEKKSD